MLWFRKQSYFFSVLPLNFRATADGNCLYNSCSILLTGQEQLHCTLRAAVSLELCLHADYYASHPYINDKIREDPEHHENLIFGLTVSNSAGSKWSAGDETKTLCVIRESVHNIKSRTWGSFMTMLALSSVVGLKIKSVYPNTSDLYDNVFNGLISPRETTEHSGDVIIMWSRVSSLDGGLGKKFKPNHFVPIITKSAATANSIILDVPTEYDKPQKLMKLDGKAAGKGCYIFF